MDARRYRPTQTRKVDDGEGLQVSAEESALVRDYALELGYGSIAALYRARVVEPALEWKRRKDEYLIYVE